MTTAIPGLLLATFLLAGCRSPSTASGSGGSRRSLEHSVLVEEAHSGVSEEARLVIRTEQAWRSFWERHASIRQPAPPLPKVDFAAEMIVVVALGPCPSEGLGVAIVGVVEDSGFLRVQAKRTYPEPGDLQALVITCPIAIARVPRRAGPVEILVD